MNIGPLEALAAEWREEARLYRRRGHEALAATVESLADELERRLHAWRLEALTLQEAAEESGYSYSHLQRLVAEGEIPNVGTRRAPRVRRMDLPRKPARRSGLQPDIADEILARRA